MLEQPPALLVTKLYMPRPRSAQVARPHLWAALDAGLERRLILVAAAAGFGKTTLVADWSAARNDTAWLSLDEGDNDPPRYRRAIHRSASNCWPRWVRHNRPHHKMSSTA
jgi:ATP/maltotriose-dependent transcriptional regulator MalT